MELEKNNRVSRNGNVVRSRTSQMEKGLVWGVQLLGFPIELEFVEVGCA
jgi:hypothetical protein